MSNYIEQPAEAKPLGDLYANWDRFADVPVSEELEAYGRCEQDHCEHAKPAAAS